MAYRSRHVLLPCFLLATVARLFGPAETVAGPRDALVSTGGFPVVNQWLLEDAAPATDHPLLSILSQLMVAGEREKTSAEVGSNWLLGLFSDLLRLNLADGAAGEGSGDSPAPIRHEPASDGPFLARSGGTENLDRNLRILPVLRGMSRALLRFGDLTISNPNRFIQPSRPDVDDDRWGMLSLATLATPLLSHAPPA